MCEELHNLIDTYKEMLKKIGGPSLVEKLLSGTDFLCEERVMADQLPPRFKVHKIELYDGTINLVEYMKKFTAKITIHGYSGEIACRLSPSP